MIAAVATLALATIVIKGLGTLLPRPPAWLAQRLESLPPALLAALVVSELTGTDGVVAFDAKAAGVGAAALLAASRAPVAVTVVTGAAVTALVRSIQ